MSTRQKDVEWEIDPGPTGRFSFEAAHLAVLQDIRDELKDINRRLSCSSTQRIPAYLARIAGNTSMVTPRKKR